MSLFNKTNTNNLRVTIAQTLFDIDMLERSPWLKWWFVQGKMSENIVCIFRNTLQ